MKLNQLTAHEIIKLIRKKKTTAQEVIRDVLEQIDKIDNTINAFLILNQEEAFNRAKEIDEIVKNNGELPPLAGIAVAVKDILVIRGIETTCGSKILKGFYPSYDATVIKKLKESGAIIIGKTNMDEFAMGSSNENSAFGPVRNPWDIKRVPGGSSGGSAAAVAANETIIALGSDTGGSVRQPASFCGMVGLKPTYGRVSRYGLIAYASSLDQIGPITKDVVDCALVMNIISGRDINDSTSADFPVCNYLNSCKEGIKNLKIGVPKEYFVEGIDQDVRTEIEKALKIFESVGAIIEEVSLPHTEYSLPAYYLISTSEASSNLARYDGVQYGYRTNNYKDLSSMYKKTRSTGFGNEVKRRIMLGTYALSSGYYDAYYLKAQKVRTLIKEDFNKVFEKFDILITPTSPTPAFKLNEKVSDPLTMYLSDIYTVPVNLAGLPAISFNCGYSRDSLPIGLQIIGKPFSEETILRAAYNFEKYCNLEKKRPKINFKSFEEEVT